MFPGEPPEQRLAFEPHDATETRRWHRGVGLRPAKDRPFVYLEHVSDLARREERRQRPHPVALGSHRSSLLAAGSRPVRRVRAQPVSFLGGERPAPLGLDDGGDLPEGFSRKDGAYLGVAGLVPPDARDRP